MSWDVIRIYWPNAAMPFALALLPLVAFTLEWQDPVQKNSWVQAQEYEMSTMPSLAGLEQPTLAVPVGSI
jgi:hypothetical protein